MNTPMGRFAAIDRRIVEGLHAQPGNHPFAHPEVVVEAKRLLKNERSPERVFEFVHERTLRLAERGFVALDPTRGWQAKGLARVTNAQRLDVLRAALRILESDSVLPAAMLDSGEAVERAIRLAGNGFIHGRNTSLDLVDTLRARLQGRSLVDWLHTKGILKISGEDLRGYQIQLLSRWVASLSH